MNRKSLCLLLIPVLFATVFFSAFAFGLPAAEAVIGYPSRDLFVGDATVIFSQPNSLWKLSECGYGNIIYPAGITSAPITKGLWQICWNTQNPNLIVIFVWNPPANDP
jgi:hypothetical protein